MNMHWYLNSEKYQVTNYTRVTRGCGKKYETKFFVPLIIIMLIFFLSFLFHPFLFLWLWFHSHLFALFVPLFCSAVTFLALHLTKGSPPSLESFAPLIFVLLWPFCAYIYPEGPHHLLAFCSTVTFLHLSPCYHISNNSLMFQTQNASFPANTKCPSTRHNNTPLAL